MTPALKPELREMPTCIITGRIAGDSDACGDCDPCGAAHTVPASVKRLLAEKDEWRRCYGGVVAALDAGTAWQPIETAPKDGTRIVAFGDIIPFRPNCPMPILDPSRRGQPEIRTISWVEIQGTDDRYEEVSPEVFKKVKYFSFAGWMATGGTDDSFRPTHWMPLPEAPKP